MKWQRIRFPNSPVSKRAHQTTDFRERMPTFDFAVLARIGHIDEWHLDFRKSAAENDMCKKASLA